VRYKASQAHGHSGENPLKPWKLWIERIDLIVTDLQMPNGAVRKTLNSSRNRSPLIRSFRWSESS
jgi:hypothetical protein